MKANRRRKDNDAVLGDDPATPPDVDANTDEVFDQFDLLFRGMVAEAELRGMAPLAVFFEWLDGLGAIDPKRATAIIVSLPIPTRIEYRRWRGGRAIGEPDDQSEL